MHVFLQRRGRGSKVNVSPGCSGLQGSTSQQVSIKHLCLLPAMAQAMPESGHDGEARGTGQESGLREAEPSAAAGPDKGEARGGLIFCSWHGQCAAWVALEPSPAVPPCLRMVSPVCRSPLSPSANWTAPHGAACSPRACPQQGPCRETPRQRTTGPLCA